VARPPDRSSAKQFRSKNYMQSWAANNPYYASHVNWAFNTLDTTRTQAAARSGIVHVAGYTNVSPQDRGIEANAWTMANPRNNMNVPYDQFGNVKKQRGDINLGLVLMGGYQFPGQAFAPTQRYGSNSGLFMANQLATWLNAKHQGILAGQTGTRYRRDARNARNRERGWETTLSQSIGSNKGTGASSLDTTIARYSTQETRLGTRATFADRRTWEGWRPLSSYRMNPHFNSRLGQMFQTENTNTGFARRVTRSGL